MTNEEKELIVYCLKANSDFHGEVCEECKNFPKCDHFQADSLMEKLIEALEQEPCEDCISRDHLLEEIASLKESLWFKDDTNCAMAIRKEAIEIVEDLCIRKEPSVNPQKPKIGHWVRWYEQKEHDLYTENIPHCKCSECGKEYDAHSSLFINYCNKCGARMEG